MEDYKNIFKFLESERLTDNERKEMRNVLRAVMREHPVRATAPFTVRYEHILSYFSSSTLRPVGFAFALVLVVGLGTSYAAENALPGEPLYAIKVGLSEPIQGALAVSPVAKAEWNTELINRRLEEAATLAAKGSLNDTARAAIEAQIESKAQNVNASVQELRTSAEGTVAASSVESDLEASLVGHERVLTGLSVDLPQQAPAIAPILHKVRMQAQESNSKRKSVERDLSVQNGETVRTAAAAQQKAAKEKIREVRSLAASKRLQASTTEEASTSVGQIEDAMHEAEQKLDAGKFGEALTTFQATIRAAKAVEVNLDAEDRLGEDLDSHGEDR